MAENGEYYWVYALVTPLAKNYCSIRIKPSSDIFPVVEELYKELLQHENDYDGSRSDAMESSGALLNKRLLELGFKNYDDFMCISLRTEMTLHNQALKKAGITRAGAFNSSSYKEKNMQLLMRTFLHLEKLSNLSEQIKIKQECFLPLNENLHAIATNTKFRTARLGEDGRTLSVISDEIERARQQIMTEFGSLNKDITKVNQAINGAALHSSLSLLQAQTQAEFKEKMHANDLSEADQIANYGWLVKDISDALEKSSEESFERFLNEVHSLVQSLNDLTKFILFLSRTIQVLNYCYVTGRSLSAPIKKAKEFIDILAELKDVARDSSKDLGELQHYVEGARSLVA